MRDDQVTHKDKFLLGRTRGMSPRILEHVSAEISFGQMIGTFPTIEHETITDPHALAITFQVGARPAGDDDWDGALTQVGQVPTADRKIIRYPLGDKYRWGERDGYELRHTINVLWREWHANDLSAGCAHQVVPEGAREADPLGYLGDRVETCPITGYRWGSQWLIKPLTGTAMERIASLELTPASRA